MAVMMARTKLMETLYGEDADLLLTNISEKKQRKIGMVEDFFNQLDSIYMDRDRYSLHWAFDNASSMINRKLESIESKMQQSEVLIDDTVAEEIKQDISRASQRYSLLSTVTLLLDIIISVILIMGLTLMAQRVEKVLEEFIIVAFFIGLIALAKVALDRFYIIPRIDIWGWNRYHNLTHAVCDKIVTRILTSSYPNPESQKQSVDTVDCN